MHIAAPVPADDRMRTAYGALRHPPPALSALAKTVGSAAPSIRWLALAPAGPIESEGANPDSEPATWFEMGGTSPRSLERGEAVRVRRLLEGLGKWD